MGDVLTTSQRKEHARKLRECRCGKWEPSMWHLIWECPEYNGVRGKHAMTYPQNRCEVRLLAKCLPEPPPMQRREDEEGIKAVIYDEIDAASIDDRRMYIAVDGALKNRSKAIGIATRNGASATTRDTMDEASVDPELAGVIKVLSYVRIGIEEKGLMGVASQSSPIVKRPWPLWRALKNLCPEDA